MEVPRPAPSERIEGRGIGSLPEGLARMLPLRMDSAEDEVSEPEASESSAPPEKDAGDGDASGEGTESSPPARPGEGTPDGERLRELERLFEVGDYAGVRRSAAALLDRCEDDEVRAAAEAILRAVQVDPVQLAVLIGCAAVLTAIGFTWVF